MSSLRLGDTVPDFAQESTEGTIRFAGAPASCSARSAALKLLLESPALLLV